MRIVNVATGQTADVKAKSMGALAKRGWVAYEEAPAEPEVDEATTKDPADQNRRAKPSTTKKD